MLLVAKIAVGYSADMVMIGNVTEYKFTRDTGLLLVTYRDPNKNNELFDIIIMHVKEVKEVDE